MKSIHIAFVATSLLSSIVYAGEPIIDMAPSMAPEPVVDGFAQARRPISNPTLFDLALPTTNVHPIYIHHALPNHIETTAGRLPLGGDVDVYALQFEIALNDRLSVVASKDGYVDMNPDNTLSDENGFGNLGAGLKYAFLLDPVSRTAVSGTFGLELPTGNTDVFQGEGKGAANLSVSALKLIDDWQFAGGAGLQIPFSDSQSTSSWMSTHVSYEVSPWFIPLVELNWFHVLDAGDGSTTAVSSIVEFEGGDYFNLGASNADQNRDLVTAAFGFRSRLCDSVDAGIAYEIPLTSEDTSLMESRLTVDFVWKF
ncbi:transporter [Luteolibacter pohnpeiensis]|uniref:Transporter n=1 Tax=Luteolibacter pohnpeiensis TaxID=454153 RepID=A0A934SBA3_9BACT|nr:transporter [Luteolibacter pohnpeiensis]MBK1882744.1 transporter [Luteolibacter pohnpeiensis]